MAKINWPRCNAAEFAAVCRVSAPVVTDWINAGMPCKRGPTKGHAVEIDIEEALPWALARREPPGSQRERLAKEQADKIALENARKRGETIYKHQVSEVLSILAADLAARHDAVAGRVAGEFAGTNDAAVIRERMLDELRNVRSAFAGTVDKLADAGGAAEDDGGDTEAAKEEDGEPMGGRKPRTPARKRGARPVEK